MTSRKIGIVFLMCIVITSLFYFFRPNIFKKNSSHNDKEIIINKLASNKSDLSLNHHRKNDIELTAKYLQDINRTINILTEKEKLNLIKFRLIWSSEDIGFFFQVRAKILAREKISTQEVEKLLSLLSYEKVMNVLSIDTNDELVLDVIQKISELKMMGIKPEEIPVLNYSNSQFFFDFYIASLSYLENIKLYDSLNFKKIINTYLKVSKNKIKKFGTITDITLVLSLSTSLYKTGKLPSYINEDTEKINKDMAKEFSKEKNNGQYIRLSDSIINESLDLANEIEKNFGNTD